MMLNEKKQEQNIELKSEKMINIVGKVPPILLSYGISIIGIVLCILLGLAYFLPHRQSYLGTVSIYTIEEDTTHQINLSVQMKFGEKRPGKAIIPNSKVLLIMPDKSIIEGILVDLSPIKDTLGRNKGKICGSAKELMDLGNVEIEFILVEDYSNLLNHFLMKFFT